MARPNGRIAGVLFIIASAQFILGLVAAEASHPDFSVSGNYISDLGVGPSAAIFNTSAFLLGLFSLIGTYFLPRTADFRCLTVLLGLMAIGAMGVGIFTSAFTEIHGAAALMAFGFGGLSAIVSFKVLKMPLSAISVALGVMTLGALALFAGGVATAGGLTSSEPPASEFFLGLGPGGMEHMIVYPAHIWVILFSGHLIALSENQETQK